MDKGRGRKPPCPFLGYAAASYEIDLDEHERLIKMAEEAIPPATARKRLKDAGWEPIARGWLPARRAKRINAEIALHEAEATRIASEPGKPGRPRMMQPPKEMGDGR